MSEPMHLAAGPVSYALFRTARVQKTLAAKLLRPTGLRPGQELVMMTLWQHGPQRMVDIVRALESGAPSMTRSIARLERMGLVRRSPSPTDRRVAVVAATEASLPLRDAVTRAWDGLEAVATSALSAAKRAQLIALLAELETALARADETTADETLADEAQAD